MLRTESDNSSNWERTAKTAFRAVIGKPLLLRRCVGVAAAAAGLTLMTLAWDGPADLVGRPQIAAPTRTNWESGLPSHDAIRTFQRYAFNGLVLPLVDDTEPPRWSRNLIDWICDGRGDVKVNGEPLIDGALVPAMFTVRWKLGRCAPLAGADLLIDGEISFAVSHDDTGLRPHLVKHNLTAEAPTGNTHGSPAVATLERNADKSAVASAP